MPGDPRAPLRSPSIGTTPRRSARSWPTRSSTEAIRAFFPKLRQASVVGHLTFGEKTWNIRYAYQQPNEKGRRIVIVTDQPVYFVGGGQTDAKPREGYGVAVVQIEVDDVGLGKGTMAAAARVKPGGPGGVQIDDYADKPIDLVTVRRMQ